MTTKFEYKEKYSWGFLFLAAVGIGGIIYAAVQPIDIKLGSKTILEYPTSKYAIWAAGALFILFAVHKWLKMKANNSSSEGIVVSGNELQFKYVKGYSVSSQQLLFAAVNELWNKTDDDDGESMILFTEESKNRYEFFSENFETSSQFAEFKKILETQCTNITNR
ncbi:hypothetical protein BH09BAC5_BH09BAC5_13510 [soil metagenome]